jgi:amino acid adenylation domain-containing protein/thioester reductase-like protein
MYKIRLSPYAKIFYTEWLLDPSSSRYNLSIDQTLYGSLDVECLRTALKRYITEYAILNRHVQDIDGESYFVENNSISELEYIDNSINQSELASYINRSFDLHNEPLYRFILVRIGDNVYRFTVVMHHLIVDGSASLDHGVFKEISNYYNNEDHAAKFSIEDQIKAIIKLTNKLYSNLDHNKDKYKEYWQQQLSDVENIDLSFLRPNKDDESFGTIGLIKFNYGEAELAKLEQVKLRHGITPYIYGQCIFAMLLHRYTGQKRLAISYPIAIKEGLDFIYGAQINTNIITYQFSKNTTIIDLFNQNKDFFKSTVRDSIKYGYYPIADIIQDNHNKQLLDVCFAQTFFREHPFNFNGITKVETHSEFSVDGVAKNILLFEHDARNNGLNYRIRYDKKAFDNELVNNFVTIYKKLYSETLNDLIQKNNVKAIYSYSLLDDEQYRKIAYDWNKTEKDYPRDRTIHQLFEEQVLKTPDNIAVVYEDTKLTYQELNNRANQLAHYLIQNYNAQSDDLIALYLDRNEQMIIAMLGVLKAGAAYVPIDPSHPDERVSHILKDTKAKIILTNAVYKNRLQQIIKRKIKKFDNINKPMGIVNVVVVNNKETQVELTKQKSINPITSATSTNLIYVIYTSGTTGKPKGVMIEHHTVISCIIYLINFNRLNSKSIGSQYAGFGFDASVIEMYPILLSGGTLHVIPKEDRTSPATINSYFHRHNITYAFLPTKFAELFFDLKNNSLTNLIVAGEKLEKFTEQSYRVANGYGPTENTVYTTNFIINKQYKNIPIGKPISNVKCYVVDNNLDLLPIGSVGELMIGGECLARGYLNRPDLTAEKFISNPFQTKKEKAQNKNSRLYKTGDMVRWLSNGNMEYIGRNDFQVQIRGHRVELGEIENVLTSYSGVKQVVVLAKEYVSERITDKYLLAYYVADKKLDETEMQAYLTAQLPEYMLPQTLVYVDKLPVTVNGKLDKKVLLEQKITNNNKRIEPSNEQEWLICTAFDQVLGTEKIGINDDFFICGGNSIQAIRLVAILQGNFDIKIVDIFNLRTPKKLAENLFFGKDILKQKLEQVKLLYRKKSDKNRTTDKKAQEKIALYLKDSSNLRLNYSSQKPITNVLLTGATGYLGCNILNQLLKLTEYNVFLLIRANSEKEAIDRINKKLQFYFDKTLDDSYISRLFVICGDIEKNNFGLSSKKHQALTAKIDSIIHSAALVKHYGDYNKFYSANVQSTINLLEFAKLTKSKDFHYISTYSVLNFGFVSNCEEYLYTEDDLPNVLEKKDNVYVQTKLLGERETVKYRKHGISSNIYRVGNLVFMEENHRTQENIEENAFYNWLKCLFKIQCVAKDISIVEMSQADLTAQAIVKLFDKKQLSDNIYHVFNPHLFNISNVLANDRTSPFITLTMEQFVDNIAYNLNNNIYHDLIVKFLLHQGWMDRRKIQSTASITVLQNRTGNILKQLGFEWPPITDNVFNKYLELLK